MCFPIADVDFDALMTGKSRPGRDRQRFPVNGRITLKSGHSETVSDQHSRFQTDSQTCILKHDNFFEGDAAFFAMPPSKHLISSRIPIPIPVFAAVRVVIIVVEADPHSRTRGCTGISDLPIRKQGRGAKKRIRDSRSSMV